MTHKTIFDVTDAGVTKYEEDDNQFTLTTEQNVAPLLDKNKEEYHSGVNTGGPFGRKVASIPLVTWQRWIKETNGEIQRDPAVLARYLNDPDNKYFRTHNSRI